MKKMKYILSAFAVAVSLSSCIEDAELTSVMTESKKQEIAEANPDKVFASAVAGMYTETQQYVYSDMSHNYFGQKSFDYLTSLMGNDMCMTGQYAMSLYHYLLDYWQENYAPTANRWRQYYSVIANSNNILKTIDPETTNAASKRYRAIALGYRGYAYLYLSYLYQYSYQVGVDGTKWGKGDNYANSPLVPLILETTTEDQPRSSVATIMAQIVSDLEASYKIFEEVGGVKTSDPTDFDGCVAAMYLARAYMIMNDWDNALKYADVVCNNFPILNTSAQIMQGFSDISLPDVVFGCDINSDNTTTYMSFFSQMDSFSDGYAGIGVWRVAFKPLVDRIANDDVRLDWFVTSRNLNTNPSIAVLSSFGALAAYYQAIKFVGCGRENLLATGSNAGWHLGDYIYLRSEEAYLMKAEILAHKGDSKAVTVLNDFMKTRQPSYNYTFSNKANLIEEIIFQKRVEFWGEGMEYLDNRRLNIPVDRTVAGTNHYPAAQFRYEQEDRVFLYQLPLSEMESNKALTPADQN